MSFGKSLTGSIVQSRRHLSGVLVLLCCVTCGCGAERTPKASNVQLPPKATPTSELAAEWTQTTEVDYKPGPSFGSGNALLDAIMPSFMDGVTQAGSSGSEISAADTPGIRRLPSDTFGDPVDFSESATEVDLPEPSEEMKLPEGAPSPSETGSATSDELSGSEAPHAASGQKPLFAPPALPPRKDTVVLPWDFAKSENLQEEETETETDENPPLPASKDTTSNDHQQKRIWDTGLPFVPVSQLPMDAENEAENPETSKPDEVELDEAPSTEAEGSDVGVTQIDRSVDGPDFSLRVPPGDLEPDSITASGDVAEGSERVVDNVQESTAINSTAKPQVTGQESHEIPTAVALGHPAPVDTNPLQGPVPNAEGEADFPAPIEGLLLHAAQARKHVQQGFATANRGMLFTARKEFLEALRTVAEAKDAVRGRRTNMDALAAGLTAVEEAEQIRRASSAVADVNLSRLVATHRTPVLREMDVTELLPLAAIDRYHEFAQQQLGNAVAGDPSGSMALYGMARLAEHLGDENSADRIACSRQAATLHEAALLAHPENYLAAHELGVVLAKLGRAERAIAMLTRSIQLVPTSTAYHNLAVVHGQLGRRQQAALAEQYAAQMAQHEQTIGAAPQRVTWLDPSAFARTSERTAVAHSMAPVPPYGTANQSGTAVHSGAALQVAPGSSGVSPLQAQQSPPWRPGARR